MAKNLKVLYARELALGNEKYACTHAPCQKAGEDWTCATCELRVHTKAATRKFVAKYLPANENVKLLRAALQKIQTLTTNRNISKIVQEALK